MLCSYYEEEDEDVVVRERSRDTKDVVGPILLLSKWDHQFYSGISDYTCNIRTPRHALGHIAKPRVHGYDMVIIDLPTVDESERILQALSTNGYAGKVLICPPKGQSVPKPCDYGFDFCGKHEALWRAKAFISGCDRVTATLIVDWLGVEEFALAYDA